MRWRIGVCLVATAVGSCAGAQQPAGAPRDPAQRSLASAIPYDAKITLLLDKPWAKAAALREVVRRLGLAKQYGAVMLVVRGTLGFDPLDPAEVRTHGFDDQGGIAAFSLAGKSSPVFVVRVADPERAQQTVQRVFEDVEQRETGEKPVFETRAAGSDGIMVVRRAHGGVQGAYAVHGGFLYLRLPGADDPVPDITRVFALEAGQGLERGPGYTSVAAPLRPADALFYISELPAQQTWLPGVRIAGGAALALDVQPERLGLRVRVLREPDPNRGTPQPAPAPRGDLAAGLPADATLWVHVSCPPALLWSELSKDLPDARRLAESMLGPNAEQVVRSSFTGNFAMAMYRSVARLRGGAVGGPQDSPGLLVIAELTERAEDVIEAVLDRGTENLSRKTRIAVQRRVASGTPLWRIAGEAIVAIHGHRLLAVLPTGPSGNVPGARGETKPPSNPAPPRWPPEATASELGVFAEVLRPGRNPLRDELSKMHADEGPRPADLFVRASGAILDFPALVRSLREIEGAQGAPLDAVNQFFRNVFSPPFQKARFEWALGRDAAQAELQWDLPEKSAATEAALAVPPANRLRDALKEARRLTKERPDAYEPHEQLATLLLEAAAGGAAREEARRAASIAPADVRAHLLLARVLERDILGRTWHVGLDVEGAEAALRKAGEIDPKNYQARVGLALLLERDKGGQRDFSEARNARAAEEIRAIREAWARGDLNGYPDGRLLEAEFFAGLFSEVVADAPRIPSSEVRDAYALAAGVASQGAGPAVKDSERIGDAAARAKTLKNAVSLLDIARRYVDAAELGRAGASAVADGAALSSRAAQDSKVSRIEAPLQPPSNPALVVEEAAIAAYDPRVPAADLVRFLATGSPIPKRAVRAGLLAISAERRAELLATDVSVATARDYFHSLSELRVEGDRDSGWRVELRSDSVTDLWWLVDEPGGPKILCRAACTEALGARALTLAEGGKTELARRVLDWARDALAKDDGRRDAHAALFASIWNGDPERVRLAAAVAAADGPRSARAVPVLAESVKTADAALRDRLKVALGLAQVTSKDADVALRSIEEVDPAVVPEVRSVRIRALLRLKRFPDAEHAIGEWLGRTPDDPFALWYAMQHGVLLDDLDRIETPARKLIRLKKFVVQAANNLAWAKYCHGRFDDDAVQVAEITSRSGSAAAVNTLATLYAETGRLDQARQTALKSVDANGAFTDDGEIGFADRYALARIWEGYGLDDLAAAEYRKLSVSKGNDSPGGDCIPAAARRRLAGLRAVQ